MKRMGWVLLALLSLNAAKADEVAYAACATCHGAQAQGNPTMFAPALAGQSSTYLTRQLHYFKDGVRGSNDKDIQGKLMVAMAKPLTDQAISGLATYLSELPAAVAPASEGNPSRGNNIYQNACGSCHGLKAEGNPLLNSPRLSGLDASYLYLQYQNFALGIRGAHPDDRFGKQMAFMSRTVTDEQQLRDVIAYITAQQ
jgi:cytochrome c553